MTMTTKPAGRPATRRIAAALAAGAALAAIAAPAAQAAPFAALDVQGAQTTPFGQVLVPVARSSADPHYFKIDASRSKADPGRTIASFRWDNDPGNPGDGDGFETTSMPSQTTLLTSGTVGKEESRRVQFTDSAGAKSNIAFVTFRVVYKPEISATAPATTLVDDPVVIDASKSKAWLDNGLPGEMAGYEWDEDNNGTFERRTGTNSPQIVHKFSKPLTQCVKVRAIDQNGATTDPANVCVKVRALPTATFTATPANPDVNQEVTLDASGSTDEGKILNYEWDLDGNGSFETNGGASPTTKTKFAKAGPATVGLRVIDNDGDKGTTTMTIQVGKPATTTPAGTPAQPGKGTPAKAPLALKLSKLKVKRGKAKAKVSCPAGAKGACTGTLKLKVGRTSIGSARFSIAAGRSSTVTVRLSRSAPRTGTAQVTATAKDRTVLAASTSLALKK